MVIRETKVSLCRGRLKVNDYFSFFLMGVCVGVMAGSVVVFFYFDSCWRKHVKEKKQWDADSFVPRSPTGWPRR